MRIFIHTGTLSLDNGATGPISKYFDLAKAVGVPADQGEFYGADSLEILDRDWPIVQELLKESRMLYRVHGVDTSWQNVQTDAVRARLGQMLATVH